jgi:hypothetical protein
LIQLNLHNLQPKRERHVQQREKDIKEERATRAKRQIHDEDAVGVDEEGMYSDTDSLVALSESSWGHTIKYFQGDPTTVKEVGSHLQNKAMAQYL